MKNAFAGWVVVVVASVVGGCSSSSGTASLNDRCESWCDRRNMDTDCGTPITSCPASCSSIILSAGADCEAQADALFTCLNDAEDICAAGGQQACSAENTALVVCTNNRTADGGV